MRINLKKHAGFKPGLTMIELLVAVSVLVILILIFSRVLGQAQKVVKSSQEGMKLNNSSGAIARVIQQDMLKISNMGFLCIMDNYVTPTIDGNTETWPQMRMYFATPGSYQCKYLPSNTTPLYTTGSIVGLGLCQQNADSAEDAMRILWRGAWGLASSVPAVNGYNSANADNVKTSDVLTPYDFSSIANETRANLFTSWIAGLDYQNNNFVPESLEVPPVTITDTQQIWKYLAVNCKKLSIMWTKGDIDNDNQLIWYGRNLDGTLITPNNDYSTSVTTNPPSNTGQYYNSDSALRFNNLMYGGANTVGVNYIYVTPTDPDSGIDDTSKWKFEFNNTLTSSWRQNGNYVAFWTSDMPVETWPKAIKITFELSDGGKGDSEVIKQYEIIRYIGQ